MSNESSIRQQRSQHWEILLEIWCQNLKLKVIGTKFATVSYTLDACLDLERAEKDRVVPGGNPELRSLHIRRVREIVYANMLNSLSLSRSLSPSCSLSLVRPNLSTNITLGFTQKPQIKVLPLKPQSHPSGTLEKFCGFIQTPKGS